MKHSATPSPEIQSIHETQKRNRWNLALKDVSYRIQKLKDLKASIQTHEDKIKKALFQDFRKPEVETELTEILVLYEEINFTIKNLKKWSKPKRLPTPMTLVGCKSYQYFEPKGHVLILAPWNYPFQLMLSPLIGAIAAGNVVMMKGSEKAPATQNVIKSVIEDCFSKEEVAVILGDIPVAEQLTSLPFDHIFFTGSTRVGRLIASAAARNLSSITLELGGKSPVVVFEDADIEKAVERIVWAKFLNAGQTCVAPDYIYVQRGLQDKLELRLKERIQAVFGKDPATQKACPHFARIIDLAAAQRLSGLLEESRSTSARLITGGDVDLNENFVAPTVFAGVDRSSPLMREEIFGPILPILSFESTEELCETFQSLDKPLAFYIFTSDRKKAERLLRSTSAGGAVINHLIVHLANPHLPFGGVGTSGLGAYHGYESFRAFSHAKSVMMASRFASVDLLSPPYGTQLHGALMKIFRWMVS